MHYRSRVVRLLLIAVLALSLGSARATGEEAPGDLRAPVTVLDGTSVWRVLRSFGPVAIAPDVDHQPAAMGTRFAPKGRFNFMTLHPEEGWQAADFDDSHWPRTHFWRKYYNGEADRRAGGGGPNINIRQISLRGKFTVTDPDRAGDLTLTFAYRGGVVVYLNGAEIARGHVDKGKLAPCALAEIYERHVYLKQDGKPWNWWHDRKKIAEGSYAKRVRRIDKMVVPSKLLRKGANVLAIEIHASPWPKEFAKKKVSPQWASAGFCELRLQTRHPQIVIPNVVRPKGLQVWNTSPLEVVGRNSYGDPHEALRAVRLYATRNGHATGRVVVSSDAPVEGLQATATALKGAGGKTIGSEAVEVSYGRICQLNNAGPRDDAMCPTPAEDLAPPPIPKYDRWTKRRHDARRADGLPLEITPGAIQSVLVTVSVPADAAPGDYAGTLSVGVKGQEAVETPVELCVAGWTVPEPKDFTTWFGLVESPEGVAMPYGAALWSAEHVKLLERSFALIARTGGKVLFIHLTAESEYGNEYSMVIWDRGPDGKLTADLSPVETFVKAATRHIKPTFVPVQVWQWSDKGKAPRITVRGEDGTLSNALGPVNGTKGAETFWRPVLTGVRDILARHGLAEAMLLASGSDRYPQKETVEVFRKILPGVGWEAHRHPPRRGESMVAVGGKVPVKYIASVWGSWNHWDPDDKRVYGWRYRAGKAGTFWCWLDRQAYDDAPFPTFRALCEQPLLANRRGLAQIGADFWPPPPKKGTYRLRTLYSRFPHSANVGGGNKGCTTNHLFYPAPSGPVPTIRYEMIRENVEECEARILLEKLLTAKPCPLPGKLARACQVVLDERTRWHRIAYSMRQPGARRLWTYSGWDRRRYELFQAAADAAAHAARRGPADAEAAWRLDPDLGDCQAPPSDALPGRPPVGG